MTRAGAVSTLRTVRYWSTTDKKWRPLFLDAAALAGPAKGAEPRGDFRPSRVSVVPRCVAVALPLSAYNVLICVRLVQVRSNRCHGAHSTKPKRLMRN